MGSNKKKVVEVVWPPCDVSSLIVRWVEFEDGSGQIQQWEDDGWEPSKIDLKSMSTAYPFDEKEQRDLGIKGNEDENSEYEPVLTGEYRDRSPDEQRQTRRNVDALAQKYDDAYREWKARD